MNPLSRDDHLAVGDAAGVPNTIVIDSIKTVAGAGAGAAGSWLACPSKATALLTRSSLQGYC